MTVISVKENTSPGVRTGTKDADEQTLGFVGSEQRVFSVQFSNDTNYVQMIQDALDYTGDSNLQDVWQSHPSDVWMYVSSKSASQVAPDMVDVTVTYTRGQDPLAMEPQYSWSFSETSEQVDYDAAGVPITNSAGDTYTEPLTKNYYDLILSYSDNKATFDKLEASKYMGSTNSDTFYGFPAKTVKCTKYTASRQRIANVYYFQRDLEFVIRYDPDDALATGWIRRVLDQGFNKKNASGVREVIKDENGDAMSEPTLLNGEGGVLGTGANPVFNQYTMESAKTFSTLAVNIA